MSIPILLVRPDHPVVDCGRYVHGRRAGLGTTVTEVAQALRPHLRRYLAFEEYMQSPDIGPAPAPPSTGLQLARPDPLRSAAGARRRVVAPPTVDYAVEAYGLRKVYRTGTANRRLSTASTYGSQWVDPRIPRSQWLRKTTTIRMLLGLRRLRPHPNLRHEVRQAIDGDRRWVHRSSQFFPAFSGAENSTAATGDRRAAPTSCSGARRSRVGGPRQVPQLLTWHETAPCDTQRYSKILTC